MLQRAGYDLMAGRIDLAELGTTLAELEATARRMARQGRRTLVHDRRDALA